MPFGARFSIASRLWALRLHWMQHFCGITPLKVGIYYGAVGKYLSESLSVAQMGLGIQDPFIIFSHFHQEDGVCDGRSGDRLRHRFVKWIGLAERRRIAATKGVQQ